MIWHASTVWRVVPRLGLPRVQSSSSSLSDADPGNEDEADDFPLTPRDVIERLRDRLGKRTLRDIRPEAQYKRK